MAREVDNEDEDVAKWRTTQRGPQRIMTIGYIMDREAGNEAKKVAKWQIMDGKAQDVSRPGRDISWPGRPRTPPLQPCQPRTAIGFYPHAASSADFSGGLVHQVHT